MRKQERKSKRSMYRYYGLIFIIPAVLISVIVLCLAFFYPVFEGEKQEEDQTPAREELTEENTVSEEELEAMLAAEEQSTAAEGEKTQQQILEENLASYDAEDYAIQIYPSTQLLLIMGKDAEGKYRLPLKAMRCSAPLEDETVQGEIVNGYRWRQAEDQTWHRYSIDVGGGYWLESVSYDAAENGALIADSYNSLGTAAEGTSILLRDNDIRWIYKNCGIETPVYLYGKDETTEWETPVYIKIPAVCRYDPTNNVEDNPWIQCKAGALITTRTEVTVERGEALDYLRYLMAKNDKGSCILDQVVYEESVDTATVGAYPVIFSVGEGENRQEVTVTFQVEDTEGPDIQIPTNLALRVKEEDIKKKATYQYVQTYINEAIKVFDQGEELDKSKCDVTLSLPAFSLYEKEAVTYIIYSVTASDYSGNTSTVHGRMMFALGTYQECSLVTEEEFASEYESFVEAQDQSSRDAEKETEKTTKKETTEKETTKKETTKTEEKTTTQATETTTGATTEKTTEPETTTAKKTTTRHKITHKSTTAGSTSGGSQTTTGGLSTTSQAEPSAAGN